MQYHHPVIIADTPSCIQREVTKIILFHAIEEVLRIITHLIEGRPADRMGAARKISCVELRPVLSFLESFAGKSILLQLHRIIVIDLESGQTGLSSRGLFFTEQRDNSSQRIRGMKEGVIIQEYNAPPLPSLH